MARFANSFLVVLLVLEATQGMASAQGRGRGGSAGASGAVSRGGSAFSNVRGGAGQRGGMGPVARPPMATPPIATPPIATPRPPVNWKNSGPSPSHYVVGHQRQVFVGSAYPGYYSSYGYPSFYSAYPYVSYDISSSQSQIQTDLANQVERLTMEVQQLRQDQANLLAQLAQAPPPRQAPEAPDAPVTLVFRDGRRLNIQNYAIVRGSLWALEEFMSTRIPLNDLDLDATRRANPGRTLLLPTGQ